MSNIFIKETKNFYNYINSTHCKDFKDQFIKYYNFNESMFINEEIHWFGFKKRQQQSLYNLYSVLRNNEFVKIRNYIFEKHSEEDEFEEWVKLLKNFAEFIYNFSDPLFISPREGGVIVKKTDSNYSSLYIYHDLFEFTIIFEKSNIKKQNSSLFDTITGLDRENNLSFIKIEIINTMSKTKYIYKYIEGSTLNPENPIPEEICDLQLEYVKAKLDKFIYDYIGIVFDKIVNNELKSYENFCIFNSVYIRNNYKDMEEEWLRTMNMESD